MNFLLTAIVAVLVFGTVVLVHEAGHFLAARHCGIHVEEFSIGFGPALWSTVRGGTRYSVRLLPLGGYNNLAGETPAESEDPDEQEREELREKLLQLNEEMIQLYKMLWKKETLHNIQK